MTEGPPATGTISNEDGEDIVSDSLPAISGPGINVDEDVEEDVEDVILSEGTCMGICNFKFTSLNVSIDMLY